MSLSHWRNEVDRLDDFMLHLVQRRLFFSRLVGKAQREEGEDIENVQRERQVLKRLSFDCTQLSYLDIESIWAHIFKVSRRERIQAIESDEAV